MQIACVSDLHGHLPEIPDCDLVLLGGDICDVWNHDRADQPKWLDTIFRRWLEAIGSPVIAVAGNHDFLFESHPHLVPSLPWTHLQDLGCEFAGLKVYGSPWPPRFGDWAFNADEPDLERRWAAIPPGTDVLLLHGPPEGFGDWSPYGECHTGSPALLRRIAVVQPPRGLRTHPFRLWSLSIRRISVR